MIRATLQAAIALVLLVGPARGQTDPLTAAPFPFEVTSGKPWVRVSTGARQNLWFVLDTGASVGSCLAWHHAQALGLAIQNVREIHTGAGEGALLRLGEVDSLALELPVGRWWAKPLTALDIAHVEPFEGRRLDGLLGSDLFFRYAVEIDYDRKQIQLHESERLAVPDDAVVLTADVSTGWPIVEAHVDFGGGKVVACSLMVDTGVRQGLVLNVPFVEDHRLRALVTGFEATIGGGAGGESRGLVTRIENLQLGTTSLEHPVVVLSSDHSGAFTRKMYDGILGGPSLARFVVTFDYPGQRLVLRPGRNQDRALSYDASGLFLVSPAPDFDRFEVLSVVEDSPADEAGLRRGDWILAVDGQPANEIALEELRARLCRPDQRVQLRLRRASVQPGGTPTDREVGLLTRTLI